MSITKQAEELDVVTNTPLEEIDVSRPGLFHKDMISPWLARLRKAAPVHYLADSDTEPLRADTSH